MEKGKVKLALIGGSAGSLEVLMQLLPGLSPGLAFPIVVVLHRKNADDNTLEELFAMKTNLPVREVEDKAHMDAGCIYVVPSDYHLLFETDGSLALDASEKVNYSRPSIDVVFESAAMAFSDGVVAILLSGSNADGTDGCVAVRECGGKVIVQNPETAEMSFMPRSAIDKVNPDLIAEPGELAGLINAL